MSPPGLLSQLETKRLILRPSTVDDAAIFRALWAERDARVPSHRRIGADGRPTVDDVAAKLRTEVEQDGPKLLTVERKRPAAVIGYCGLTARGNGSMDEPELAYELLCAVHGHGYATEAAQAVVTWASQAGYRVLWAGVWDWNVASRRVLEKLGFRETGDIGSRSVHGYSLLTMREL